MRDAAGQPSGALRVSRLLRLQAGNASKCVFAPLGNLIWKRRRAGGCAPSGFAIVTPTPSPIAHGCPAGWAGRVGGVVGVVVGAPLAGAAEAARAGGGGEGG